MIDESFLVWNVNKNHRNTFLNLKPRLQLAYLNILLKVIWFNSKEKYI